MKELPLRSDEELRGDHFAEKIEGNFLTKILHKQGQKLADEINCIKEREKHNKSCHCHSCTQSRKSEAEFKVDDLNWTVSMIARPEDRGKERLEVFDKENGKGWDLKVVKKDGGVGVFRPRLK